MTKITSRTTVSEIAAMLRADGYGGVSRRAAEIKKAALAGCLLWTPHRLTTTDSSRIDERPRGSR